MNENSFAFYNIFVGKSGDVIAAYRTAIVPALSSDVVIENKLYRVASPPYIYRVAFMSGHVAVITLAPVKETT